MRIVCLMENTAGAPGCCFEHGLSLYIEAAGHKLLSDTGASAAFLENAALLGIDLTAVDTVVLSHGHYDHCGGLLAFAERNRRGAVYLRRTGGQAYYAMHKSGPRYIGIDRRILALPQLRLLDADLCLWEGQPAPDTASHAPEAVPVDAPAILSAARAGNGLHLMGGVSGRRRWAKSNRKLKRKLETDGSFVQDNFDHEQSLVVRQDGRYYLFSGCAHNGILNILDRFRELYGRDPDLAVTGFHFMKATDYTPEEWEDIEATARELSTLPTRFYSGHCTGQAAFDRMREIMGEQLLPLHSGMEIPVP